jgi:hypothetical protein
MRLPELTGPQVHEIIAITTALKLELEARLLGTVRPGRSCCCGSLKFGPATVANIRSPFDKFRQRENSGYSDWSVEMSTSEKKHAYTLHLTKFMSHEELCTIFERHYLKFLQAYFPVELEAERLRRAAVKVELWW